MLGRIEIPIDDVHWGLAAARNELLEERVYLGLCAGFQGAYAAVQVRGLDTARDDDAGQDNQGNCGVTTPGPGKRKRSRVTV